MSALTKDELLNKIREIVGDSEASDNVLELYDDIEDTYTSFNTELPGNEDWKTKYEENDKAWRERYKNRFFNRGDNKDEPPDTKPDEELTHAKTITIDDLFKEKE